MTVRYKSCSPLYKCFVLFRIRERERKSNNSTFGDSQRICPSIWWKLKCDLEMTPTWNMEKTYLPLGVRPYLGIDPQQTKPRGSSAQHSPLTVHMLCGEWPQWFTLSTTVCLWKPGWGNSCPGSVLCPVERSLGGRWTPGCWVILHTFRWSHGIEHSLGRHWHNAHFFRGCGWSMRVFMQRIN